MDLTPALTVKILEAKIKARKDDMENQRWLVWHTAALGRAKTLPHLKKFVTVEQKQSPAEVEAFFRNYQVMWEAVNKWQSSSD